LLLLGGCSWFANDDEQVAAKVLPPLEVPPDLVTPQGDPSLVPPVLPEVSSAPRQSSEPPRVAESSLPRLGERVLPPGKGVQRMREGQRRWLLVAAEPEQVWPLAQKFLTQRGYRISHDEPAVGLLETAWKARFSEGEKNLQANERESLRLRIEPAEKPGNSEIFLSQRSSRRLPAEDDAEPTWQLQPPDEDRAAEMLNRLARYLAAEDVEEAVPLKPLDSQIKTDADGHSALLIAAAFEPAWRRTGLALQALGFTVEDSDQANGIYYVYNELPSGKTKEELMHGKEQSATVREEYWLHVKASGDETAVSVHRKDGQADDSRLAGHLLTLLQGQLQ
jgi:outer membrane protein assembly factor BamC